MGLLALVSGCDLFDSDPSDGGSSSPGNATAIRGLFGGSTTFNIDTTSCEAPASISTSASMLLRNVSGDAFAAELRNTTTLEGVAFLEVMNLSGRVSIDGTVSGTYEEQLFLDGDLDSGGTGTFHGTFDRSLTQVYVQFSGTDTFGDTCRISGATNLSRRPPTPVEIRMAAFIRCPVIEGPLGALDPNFWTGDARDFDYFLMTLRSRAWLSMSLSAEQLDSETHDVGISHRYRRDDVEGAEQGIPECSYVCGFQLRNGATADCSSAGSFLDGTPTVNFRALDVGSNYMGGRVEFGYVAKAGCTSSLAAWKSIVACGHIDVRQQVVNGEYGPPEYRLVLNHSYFPWHELYVNGVPVRQYSPCGTRAGLLNLVDHCREDPATTIRYPYPVPEGAWEVAP